jgi:arylsulfatase A-like enzyme
LEAPPARLALLALIALGGGVATALGHPGAKQAAIVLFPDTRLVVALFAAPNTVAASSGTIQGELMAPFSAATTAQSANVLVLMLESIPWDRLHGLEARPESTPRLLELARRSIVFDRAYATSTHSDYAQTSILASLHPRKGPGHDYFTRLDYPRTLFWDPLHALGYRTALFSCQNESWGNMIAFNRTAGLELFRHSPDWPDAPRRGEGAESKVFEPAPVAAFFEWLDREPARPFAVYLNFQATHYPYMVPEGWPAPYQPSALDFATTFLSYPRDKIPVMENRFHNALAYVDLHVGRVLDGLAARGLLEKTALLVVSDHGEAFYEHGMPTHGTMLLEEQVRTAMLLSLPGEAPRRVEQPVSVLDAIPVVFRYLGLPRHGNFQGRDDVLDPGYDGAARPLPMTIQGMTREDGLLLGDWKLVLNHDRRERALFFLGDDPGELRNRAAAEPERAAALERELVSVLGEQLEYYRARGWESGRYPPPLP